MESVARSIRSQISDITEDTHHAEREQVNAPINIDSDPMNADWPKRTWDLPPYKSEEFMRFLQSSGTTLEEFRKLPVYVFAVQRGVIVDGEWVGNAGEGT